MTGKFKWLVLALGLLVVTGFSAGSAKAGNFTFLMKSRYPYKVSVAFYSKSRGHVWPGVRKGYVLADSKVHEFNLSCRYGEKICYGAWVTGNTRKYWGVGFRGYKGCRGCCYRCRGGESKIHILQQ